MALAPHGIDATAKTFDTSILFDDYTDSYHLYNHKDSYLPDHVKIGGNGQLAFTDRPLFWDFYFPLPFDGFPDEIIAPLWRSGNLVLNRNSFHTELDWNSDGI